jgi:hypothetical protein
MHFSAAAVTATDVSVADTAVVAVRFISPTVARSSQQLPVVIRTFRHEL